MSQSGPGHVEGEEDFFSLQSIPFHTVADLTDAVNRVAKPLGYAVVKKSPSNRDAAGQYTRFEIYCTCHGIEKQRDADSRKRKRGTMKTNCKWRGKATTSAIDGRVVWKFQLLHDQHNHDPFEEGSRMATHRRRDLSDEGIRKKIWLLHTTTSHSCAQIASQIRDENPDISATRHNIRNIIADQRHELHGTLTTFQRFLSIIRNDEDVISRVARGPDGTINRIFITFREAIQMWTENPEVISYDATEGCNIFDMPLIQINGITCLNTTFNFGWALCGGKDENFHAWVFEMLKEIAAQTGNNIRDPYVIVTDYDAAAKKGAARVYPNAKQQICVWHVMKNVAYKIKTLWIGQLKDTALGEAGGTGKRIAVDNNIDSNEQHDKPNGSDSAIASRLVNSESRAIRNGNEKVNKSLKRDIPGYAPRGSDRIYLNNADGILCAWKDTVYAGNEDDFQKTWRLLMKEFNEQADIINYLRETWIPVADDFAHYAICEVRNFGVRVTSRTENSHWLLKRLLRKKRADLEQLFHAIVKMTSEQREKYYERLGKEENSVLPEWKQARDLNVTNQVFKLISHHAMELLIKQVQLAVALVEKADLVDNWSDVCTGRFTIQFGVPCCHKIASLILTNGRVVIQDIDLHHHLKRRIKWTDNQIREFQERNLYSVRRKLKNGRQPLRDWAWLDNIIRDRNGDPVEEMMEIRAPNGVTSSGRIRSADEARPTRGRVGRGGANNTKHTARPTLASIRRDQEVFQEAVLARLDQLSQASAETPFESSQQLQQPIPEASINLEATSSAHVAPLLSPRRPGFRTPAELLRERRCDTLQPPPQPKMHLEWLPPNTVSSHGRATTRGTTTRNGGTTATRSRGTSNAAVATKKMSYYDRLNARLDAEEKSQPSTAQCLEWRTKGYPKLDYENDTFVAELEARVRRICDEYIKGIIVTENSHFHRVLKEKIGDTRRRIGTVEGAFMQVGPGYYGPRGRELMSPLITEKVHNDMKNRQDTEGSLVRMRGGGAYILAVLVPEVALRLIMEDLSIEEEAAIAVLEESTALGEVFHKEMQGSRGEGR